MRYGAVDVYYPPSGGARAAVAKTAFRSATHAASVHRGSATRPLYVTAAGVSLEDAARLVAAMAGPYRLPDALRRVDRLSRTGPF